MLEYARPSPTLLGLLFVITVMSCAATGSAQESAAPAADTDADAEEPAGMHGIHPFVGADLGFGGAQFLNIGKGDLAGGGAAFLFGLRGGVLIERHELSAEISPMTYVPITVSGLQGPSVQFTAGYGVYIPIRERPGMSIYWPMRLQFGGLFGNTVLGLGYFQLVAELVGIALRVPVGSGAIVIDFHGPSFRYAVSGNGNKSAAMYLTIMPGVAASYVF